MYPNPPQNPRRAREGKPFFGKLQALEGPLTPLWEGGGSEILGEKPRSPAAFCLLEKAKAPLLEGGIFFIYSSTRPHSQPKQVSTYMRIYNPPNLFLLPVNWPCVPRFWPGGTPWLPCAAGHAVVGPVWPDRAGGGRLAPQCPREDHPPPGTFGHRHTGLPTPLCSSLATYVPLSGKDLEARGPPPGGAKAGPQAGKTWGVRSRLSVHVAKGTLLRTPPGIRYPDGSPKAHLFAWSPPLVRVVYPRALRVSPYGQHDETPLRFHYPTPPAFIRGPQPRPAGRAQRFPR